MNLRLGSICSPALSSQPSDDGTGSCRYYLSSPSDTTCITRGEYDIAVARAQAIGRRRCCLPLVRTIAASSRRSS